MNIYLSGGKTLILDPKKFYASGGEGDLYKDGDILYKVFHSLPEQGRVIDLSVIKDPNVIRPIESFTDGKKTVGYTFRYVKAFPQADLYTSVNKSAFNLNNDDIRELIKDNWERLESCHKESVLVVDYNGYNLLYSKDKSIYNTYLIDVLSFQTRNYPATAIMQDIEDYLAKRNFTVESDYYSFYLHSFRMLTGLHPYQGNHPKFGNYSREKIGERQQNKITVFDSEIVIPPVFRNFQSLLSKDEIDLYRSVFIDGNRPKPDFKSIMLIPFTPVINTSPYTVKNGNNFKLVPILQSKAWKVIDGQALTEPSVKVQDKSRRLPIEIISQYSFKLNGESYDCDKYSINESFVLYVLEENLFRLSLVEAGGKIFNQVQLVSRVNSNAQVFDNLCIQYLPDFVYVSGTTEKTFTSTILKELKGYRIYDAKQIDNVMCFIATKDGMTYDFFYIKQNPHNPVQYSIAKKENCDLGNINFAIKENGVVLCILPSDEVILFNIQWDNTDHSVTKDSVLTNEYKIYTKNNDVILASDSIIYTLQKK